MIVIIAGTRGFTDIHVLIESINELDWKFTEIVSGHEPTGVDRLGEDFARVNHIPVRLFPADWNKYGKAAGPIRNEAMIRYATENEGRLLVLWDGESKGTANILSLAKRYKVPTFIRYI